MRIAPGAVRGTVRAPPSKSYTHRALVLGWLSGRRFEIRRPLESEDTLATLHGLESFGARVSQRPRAWTVGPAPRVPRGNERPRVRCGRSGTTLRLLAAVAALERWPVRFEVDRQLARRPIEPLLAALRSLGADVRTSERGASGFPLTIRGPVHGGRVSVTVSESSQFASALLFVLPVLRSRSVLRLRGPIVSKPYLDATVALLRRHGARFSIRGRVVRIPGGQRYAPGAFSVPGDASSAAYLWAAAALTGGKVTVRGIETQWPQADLAILPILRRMGAAVTRSTTGTTVSGRLLRPVQATLTATPDLLPLVGVLAAATPGTSRLLGAAHARHKESDRRQETARLARALGATVRLSPRRLEIEGSSSPRDLHMTGAQDHRLVMSAAVAALAAHRTSVVGEADAVRKSFPEFWTILRALGAGVRLEP